MDRPFSALYIWKSFLKIIPFFGVTLSVTLLTSLFAFIISIAVLIQRYSKNKIISRTAEAFVQAVRCTPSIVMLFIVFYGLPKLFDVLFSININFWPRIVFVVTALSLIYGAVLSEIFRAAYIAVGKDQMEAALSMGLTKAQAARRILFPQMLVVAVPNLGNALVSLLKEGSLAYTIGLIDMMGEGNLFISRNYGAYAVETYISLAIIYWLLTLMADRIFLKIERHFARGMQRL